MELIARHAKDLPALDNFIIKRINNFGCYYWHLKVGACINDNNACFVHAIALIHNKCFFKLLKYYSMWKFWPDILHLMHMCAFFDNLEALKYMCTIKPKYILKYYIINYALSGASFKCAIFCGENDTLPVSEFIYKYVSDITYFQDIKWQLKWNPSHVTALELRGLNYTTNIRKYMINNNLIV